MLKMGLLVVGIGLLLLAGEFLVVAKHKGLLFAQEKRAWSGIVVHHSGSGHDTVESMDEYHKSKGWDGIGYHYVIYRNGKRYPGRPVDKMGAHALTGKEYSRNKTHIGICLVGDQEFTKEQISALYQLCRVLSTRYPLKSIERHHEKCPGPGVDVEALEEWALGSKVLDNVEGN